MNTFTIDNFEFIIKRLRIKLTIKLKYLFFVILQTNTITTLPKLSFSLICGQVLTKKAQVLTKKKLQYCFLKITQFQFFANP